MAAPAAARGEGGRRDNLLRDIGPRPAQHKAAAVITVEEFNADGVRASHEINRTGFLLHSVKPVIVDQEDVINVDFGAVVALTRQRPLS